MKQTNKQKITKQYRLYTSFSPTVSGAPPLHNKTTELRRCHLRAKCSRGRNENSSSHDISAVVVAVCWGDSLRDWVDSLGIEDASEELKARRMLGWVFAFTKSI